MNISDSLLPVFDMEMANTRKMLERVPDEKFDWRPHVKSMPMGELVAHLAHLPSWATMTLTTESVDFNPETHQMAPVPSRQSALEQFDANIAAARAAMAATSDEEWMKPWSLLIKGKNAFTMPRIAVLRGFVMSHSIHHRAQLGLYLRLNDIPLPPIYGPTADEGVM